MLTERNKTKHKIIVAKLLYLLVDTCSSQTCTFKKPLRECFAKPK